jgi:TetR/AcrR family transcriptional regulator, regulator of cefoperazone and chloramphenicol sensitivity
MSKETDTGTKERLLAAAREVFAARGPREATVRDICALARANVAAINYHFGGKEKLFMAVLAGYVQRALDRYPVRMGLGPEAKPEERLRAFIRSLLYRLMGDGDPLEEKLGQLLTTELVDPSDHFDLVAERYLMPVHDELLDIVRLLLPGGPEQAVQLAAAGVTGHCLLFDQMKQLIRRMRPEMGLEALGVETVADFVYRFALAGIVSLSSRP